jgi:hypothetical protein
MESPQLPQPLFENNNMQAMLFSLSTRGPYNANSFDPSIERICIDTGASASISTKRQNFIQLHPVTNLKINGFGAGLPVKGFGILKWSICDDKNNDIDLYSRGALFVPTAPMGLLCPQQIAQQIGVAGDGFTSLASNGVLRFQGFQRTVPYETRTRLPIFHTMECCKALTTTLANNIPATTMILVQPCPIVRNYYYDGTTVYHI